MIHMINGNERIKIIGIRNHQLHIYFARIIYTLPTKQISSLLLCKTVQQNVKIQPLMPVRCWYDIIYMYIYSSLARKAYSESKDAELVMRYIITSIIHTWWRHRMGIFFALLTLCAGKSLVTGKFSSQRPVTRSFDVFVDLRLDKRLSKQWWGWWFETPSRPLWHHCNEMVLTSTSCL